MYAFILFKVSNLENLKQHSFFKINLKQHYLKLYIIILHANLLISQHFDLNILALRNLTPICIFSITATRSIG